MEASIESKSKVNRYWVFLVIAWSIHNAEEALTMPEWIGRNTNKLPFSFSFPTQVIQQALPVAFILVTVLIILIAFFAIAKKWDNRVLGVVLGIFLVNALHHILTTLVLWQYSPGVITAFFINLPMAVFIVNQLFKQKLLKAFSWVHIVGYGAIAMIVALAMIWMVAICLIKIF